MCKSSIFVKKSCRVVPSIQNGLTEYSNPLVNATSSSCDSVNNKPITDQITVVLLDAGLGFMYSPPCVPREAAARHDNQ